MSKIAILTAMSGALVAGSLALAGPAAAHRGDAGDGSATPAGLASTSTSAHTTTDGQIGVGIFTAPATASGGPVDFPKCPTCVVPVHHFDSSDQQIGVGIFTAPATAAGPGSITPGITSRAAVGGEQPYGPVGAAPAA